MVDAESGWKDVVEEANERFKAATKADVKVEYQQWANRSPGSTPRWPAATRPDVVELGNTDMPKYVFNGAFAEIDKSRFENSGTWLTGLSDPCTLDGKTYCVPYYAGARVLIYRTDLLEEVRPQAADDLRRADRRGGQAQGRQRGRPELRRVLHAGAYWYAAMSWVYGEGGRSPPRARTASGPARCRSRKALAGLQKWADLQKKYSKGDPTKDENDQDAIFAQGHAAFLYGNGWEVGAVQSQKTDPNDPNSAMVDTAVKGKVAAVPLPGATAGKGLPTFLGGSAIAVTGKSKKKALGPGVGQVLHRHPVAGGPDRQGRAAQRDLPAGQGGRGQGQRGDRARGEEQLVRADGAEVGRRRVAATSCSRCCVTSPPAPRRWRTRQSGPTGRSRRYSSQLSRCTEVGRPQLGGPPPYRARFS